MKQMLLILAAILLWGNAAALLMYHTVVLGSYLFVTAGTVLMPLVAADILLGAGCLASFIWSASRLTRK